jgi:hypothetical protein
MSTVAKRSHESPKQSMSEDSGNTTIEEKANYVMEDVSRFTTIFITIYMALILSQSPNINEYMAKRGGSISYWEFLWIIPGMLFSYGLFVVCTKYLAKLLQPYLKEVNYREEESHEQRLHRIGVSIMGLIYYVWSFSTLYYLSYGTQFLPVVYGGYLQYDNYVNEWPLKTSIAIRITYLIGLGHHLERLIVHMFESRASKSYYTMNLHHILTVYLIALSYFMNHFLFGVAVFILHDLSDALLWASRLLRETRFERATIVTFLLMTASWFHERVYGFIVEVIYKLLLMMIHPRKFFSKFYFSHLFFFTALFLLATLNVYWCFQILQIAITKFIKKMDKLPFEDAKRKGKAQ